MFRLAALSALVAGAAAFAPAQQGASSTALASAFENEVSCLVCGTCCKGMVASSFRLLRTVHVLRS